MKVGVDRHIVAEPLRRRKQGGEFNLFDRLVLYFSRLAFTNGSENLIFAEGSKRIHDLWLFLEKCQVCAVVDDLKVVPQPFNNNIDDVSPVRQGKNADHLREIRVGCSSN